MNSGYWRVCLNYRWEKREMLVMKIMEILLLLVKERLQVGHGSRSGEGEDRVTTSEGVKGLRSCSWMLSWL